MATTAQQSMEKLYRRLRAVGLDTPYVRETALPSWWDESVAESPSGYQETLLLLSRHLGLCLNSLLDSEAPIELRNFGPCNFKKSQGVAEHELALSRAVATRAAQIAAASLPTCERGLIPTSGLAIRESILRSGAPWVGLASLVDWCWSNGIPVLHVSRLPRGTKKMDGMAALVDGRPVVVLCKRMKQEAWQLFILAHELGHFVNGHVSQNGVLVDEGITHDLDSVDAQEVEANETALEILTGDAHRRFFTTGRWPNAAKLAEMATSYGKDHQVDPGHAVLNYSHDRGSSFLKLGNAALSLINPHADAAKLINERMAARLDWNGIPEDSSEFLMQVTAPKPAT